MDDSRLGCDHDHGCPASAQSPGTCPVFPPANEAGFIATGIVHYLDAKVQYLSMAFTDALTDAGLQNLWSIQQLEQNKLLSDA